ncbi:MAG: hypothetical protein GY817_09325 [bacterium]|nr:hypothetical protein [bacterium]
MLELKIKFLKRKLLKSFNKLKCKYDNIFNYKINEYILTDDGTKLRANVYLPHRLAKFPTILTTTI